MTAADLLLSRSLAVARPALLRLLEAIAACPDDGRCDALATRCLACIAEMERLTGQLPEELREEARK